MNLLIKAQPLEEGYQPIASPSNSSLKELDFARLRLRCRGELYTEETEGREVVLTFLTGRADVEIGNVKYLSIGGRKDVFAQPPTVVYIPPGSSYLVRAASSHADILVSKAPAEEGGQPALIRPEEVEVRWVGAANWRRKVNVALAEDGPSKRLMVGETISLPGNWSSYPPHKHDTDNPPQEIWLEEVYFYLTKPEGGFGLQCLYERREGGLREVYMVESGDTVVFPCGYHPAVAAPGYQLYYFWALVGTEKLYGAWSDDPAHAWVRNLEPMLLGGMK